MLVFLIQFLFKGHFYFNFQMVFVSCLHFWVYTTPTIDWVIVWKIHIFNHTNNISFFLFTSHLFIIAVFFKHFCIHIPHNSSTTPLACIWNITLHSCFSTRTPFLCKKFQIYAGSLFPHFPFISMRGHWPWSVKIFFFYIPSEQPNQGHFFLFV